MRYLTSGWLNPYAPPRITLGPPHGAQRPHRGPSGSFWQLAGLILPPLKIAIRGEGGSPGCRGTPHTSAVRNEGWTICTLVKMCTGASRPLH
ncbi:hypothetical protein Pmani_002987 [Petrolisthes manimaculis]|uniref:Uncharacterized protein n=1 Tax=Petrolisthes manimaculis TaxID=1843537 RepID=A0AAE1QGN8_9EUCA|nr:hypothetical protein Pmani_002987 [Petrolisthes manimaculis]